MTETFGPGIKTLARSRVLAALELSHAWSNPSPVSLCAGLHRKSVNANRPSLYLRQRVTPLTKPLLIMCQPEAPKSDLLTNHLLAHHPFHDYQIKSIS
jgi:hypothetical protein